jgi:hypothetical protein
MFYLALNQDYATMSARDWNARQNISRSGNARMLLEIWRVTAATD